MNTPKSNNSCCCSFCGKLNTQVAKLIAGPGVYICNECVIVCGEILAQEIPDWPKFLRCQKDPLKATHDMLTSMRDSREISPQVFTVRLAEAAVREFTPAPPPRPNTKTKGVRSKGKA